MSYEDAEIYDYPSVGQIARALREQEIIPIFAATSSQQPLYEVSQQEVSPFGSVRLIN